MSCFLGIDTSNYTTSAALYLNNEIIQKKKLLPVKSGGCGLRQSDTIFYHNSALHELLSSLPLVKIDGIGVSAYPRRQEGSYMPCFTVGLNNAKILSHFLGVQLYEFSHQEGHIMAALYSAKKMDLLGKRFIAFHVSGGTTEALLVEPSKESPFKCTIISKSLDLKAGQAIDRTGVMLGLDFPCGKHLEKLSNNADKIIKYKPSMKGCDCSLSGIENKIQKLYEDGEIKENIAMFCINAVYSTIDKMTEEILKEYGNHPIIYAGGVMSNNFIKNKLSEKYGGFFAEPDFSSDNAAGVAILASYKG